MKITIKRTEDHLALIKQMGSSNREEAYEAQAAVATLMGPVISEVINNAPSISNLFKTMIFGADDNPSIPLDLFHDITDEDYIQVYSQQVAGGLPYSQVFPAHNELKFSTYTLDSALAFDKKYAKKARLDVVAKTFTRMAQEVLLKQERTAFNLNDFNRLITKSKRINSSFSAGTPVGGSKVGVTDLLVSPEMVQELRSMAYNPVNTRSGAVATSGASSLPAPEELRAQLYSAAGLPSFYGINIIEILELGIGQRFNTIFNTIVGLESASVVGGGNTGGFEPNNDEILIGIDRSRDSLIRPVVLEEGSSDQLTVAVDDQFSIRQNKVGYFGKLEEGRICIDDKALMGLVV